MKIRIKSKKALKGSKLMFVKLIKEYSGLGLKDSKDLCDPLFESNSQLEFELSEERFNLNYTQILIRLKKELYKIDDCLLLVNNNRNVKLLSLGLGEKKEYINFLSENISFLNDEEIKDFLNILNKDKLIKLTNKINKIYESNI